MFIQFTWFRQNTVFSYWILNDVAVGRVVIIYSSAILRITSTLLQARAHVPFTIHIVAL